MTELERIVEAARVSPGDALVVRVHRNCTADEMTELGHALREALPDVTVAIVGGGVEQLVVLEGGAR